MSLYRLFIIAFILSSVAFGIFMYHYVHLIMDMIALSDYTQHGPVPGDIAARLLSPVILISGLVLGCCSLLYRILGIVFIIRNPLLDGGEKAIWILGFILLGFITAILFMILAPSRGLTATEVIKEDAPLKYS